MTVAQIIETINHFIGRISFGSNGVASTSAGAGILRVMGRFLNIINPSSSSFVPIVFIFVILSFVGLGLGLIKRLIN